MKQVLLLMFFCGVMLLATAQVPPGSAPSQGADSTSKLEILRADRYNFEKIDSATSLLSLAGNVLLKQDGTLFYTDSALVNQLTRQVEAFGKVRINDGDSLNTYANYMRYTGADRQAYLKGNVKLMDNKGGVLTTPELWYDLNIKVATYKANGRVVTKNSVLTSTGGQYYGETHDVIFRKNVVLKSPEYNIFTDSLLYNTQNELATIESPTTIVSGTRKIYTRSGYYDLKQGKAYFTNRPAIVDSSSSIVADDIRLDNKSGIGQFRGNVVFNDTANQVSILSNQLFVNNKKSSFMATEKPLMVIKQENDSIYITADTLFSGKITDMPKGRVIPVINDTLGKSWKAPDLKGKDSSQDRFFEAWYHVRIFTDSMQAVADSFFYGATDSAFRLFKNPVVWGGESQISADTIYLFTANQKPQRMFAFFNGFIANKVGARQFNQIKGNTINALFKDGAIDYMRAKGRAETVYYAQDPENKFVGMNHATCDAVDLFFKDQKPLKVKFINDLKGTTFPIRKIPPGESEIKGFKWQESRRPKTRLQMMGE